MSGRLSRAAWILGKLLAGRRLFGKSGGWLSVTHQCGIQMLGPDKIETTGIRMETIKTASFEYLISLAKELPEGGFLFRLDGIDYQISDVLEISRIADRHGYIVIY